MDYVYLGKRIRDRRKALKYSQEKLSEIADITTSYMGQIERAERIPSLETLVNISNALGVTVDFLLTDSIKIYDDVYVKQFSELVFNKSKKAKATAIDVVQALFLNIE